MTTKKQKVLSIIQTQLGVHPEQVLETSNFISDLGADSIDLFELTFDIENEFPVSFTDADIASFKTIGNLISFMDSKGLLKD
jgi:acyl carrier protein